MKPLPLIFAIILFGIADAAHAQSLRQQSAAEGRAFIVPANDLERALVTFADNPTPGTQTAVASALVTSVVYVKVEKSDLPGLAARTNEGMSVWSVQLADGGQAVALFTSKERLAQAFAHEPEIAYAGMEGVAALEMARDSQVALNWGVDPHMLWGPDFTARVLNNVDRLRPAVDPRPPASAPPGS